MSYSQNSAGGITKPDFVDEAKQDIDSWSNSYPSALRDISNAPKVLHVLGDANAICEDCIAIVGARKATPYGIACAQRFAYLAARYGVNVVSGGAIGCDQAAHQGALKGSGKTIAILGSGADVAYPRRSKPVFEKMLQFRGALVSELPWGSPPQKWAFRRRNRLIAGIAKAVLIVEAGIPSGTFSTADYALEYGKEVLVIPGGIFSKESAGSNRLLADGATPIIDEDSFLSALDRLFGSRKTASVKNQARQTIGISWDAQGAAKNELQSEILRLLASESCMVDELVNTLDKTVIEIIRELSELETRGVVARYPDGRFGIDGRIA